MVKPRAVANEISDDIFREWGLSGVVIYEVNARLEVGGYVEWLQTRRDWCAANLKGHFSIDLRTMMTFLFDDPDDAFAFKMRWA